MLEGLPKVPNHIAIIPDGNRTYSKENNYANTLKGHKEGLENIFRIAQESEDLGVDHVSVWGLSVDNIKRRSKKEITYLFKFMNNRFQEKIEEKGRKLNFIGDINLIPEDKQAIINETMEVTKNNTGLQLNLALAYDHDADIEQADKKKSQLQSQGNLPSDAKLGDYMRTTGMPEVDLLIRTKGHKRHGGFLSDLSKRAYHYFTDTLRPEFSEEELRRAIKEWANDEQNMGK